MQRRVLILVGCAATAVSSWCVSARAAVDDGGTGTEQVVCKGAPGPAKGSACVRVTLDRTTLRVADRLNLVIEVNAPAGVNVRWPEFEKELGPFSVAGKRDGNVARLALEPSGTGKLTIPSLAFDILATSGSAPAVTVRTEPIDVQVQSVLGENEMGEKPDAGAIRGVVDEPRGRVHPAVYIAGGVIAAGLVFGVLKLAAGGRKKRVVVLSPEEEAMGSLDRIEAAPVAEGQAGAVMGQLAEVLRIYLAREFRLESMDLTTPQLLAAVEDEPGVPQEQLRMVLGQLDQARFAGLAMSGGDVKPAAADVREVVRTIARERMKQAAEALAQARKARAA